MWTSVDHASIKQIWRSCSHERNGYRFPDYSNGTCFGTQRVSPFFHDLDLGLVGLLGLLGSLLLVEQLLNPIPSSKHVSKNLWKRSIYHVPFQRWDPYCLQMNVHGLNSFQQRISPFPHDLDLELVGSIGNF